jgi:hypothetical protein
VSELVANCPRCKARLITFDVLDQTVVAGRHDWQNIYETFCVCRACKRSTVFVLADDGYDQSKINFKTGLSNLKGELTDFVRNEGYVSLKDAIAIAPPDYVPPEIQAIFSEGTKCLAIDCFNAAGTMFRLCVDMVTKSILPDGDLNGLNSKVRRNLGLRMPWLFDNGLLPEALRELSACIKEDGNDGAHEGSLMKVDAEDLLDFTTTLLERIYTEPERLRLAKERRVERRSV